jgi:hypothetical protein
LEEKAKEEKKKEGIYLRQRSTPLHHHLHRLKPLLLLCIDAKAAKSKGVADTTTATGGGTRKSRAAAAATTEGEKKDVSASGATATTTSGGSDDPTAAASSSSSVSDNKDGDVTTRVPVPDVGGMRLSYNGIELDNNMTINDYGDIDKDSILEQMPPEPTTGRARFKWPNGATYDGEWAMFDRERRRHGTGTWSIAGETYVGEWSADMIHGRGRYTFASGAIYDGQWSQGKFHGRGTYLWPPSTARTAVGAAGGASYVGEWRDNKMHGQGIFVAASGDRFQGTFHNDRFLNGIASRLAMQHCNLNGCLSVLQRKVIG